MLTCFLSIISLAILHSAAEGEAWASHGRNVSVGQWAATHVLTGLSPHLTYAVRLMAHNDLGVSLPSPTQLFTTTEEGECLGDSSIDL